MNAPDPMSPDKRESDLAKIRLTEYAKRLIEQHERRPGCGPDIFDLPPRVVGPELDLSQPPAPSGDKRFGPRMRPIGGWKGRPR